MGPGQDLGPGSWGQAVGTGAQAGVDAGAGTETDPAGRYLEPDHLGGEHFQINLNDAYNPYCAYNDAWTCPIPPAENRLAVHIRAGEKLPQDEWVNHG